MQKRILAIHDISCIGKCSLTVVLPVISAAGIETSVLPTAVLSTHTGGFCGYAFKDLTDEILPITEHWEKLGIKFDAVYTGYLGSVFQTELVGKIIEKFSRKESIIFVDPVMGDNGKLYAGFDEKYVSGIKKLCSAADIIVPNMTEAALLTKTEYIAEGYDKGYVEEILCKLSELGPKNVIISGVSFDDSLLGAAAYDRNTGKVSYCFGEKIEGMYHGSGDVFASAVIASVLRGNSIEKSINIAVEFTLSSIKRTKNAGTDTRYGLDFENGLYDFIKSLG